CPTAGISARTRWCARRPMPSGCASVQTASPRTCARPWNMASKRASSNPVNWLSILMSLRIWTPGAGTIAPIRALAPGETGLKARLLLAAAAAWLAIAPMTSFAQDDKASSGHSTKEESIKQDAGELGAKVKRDAKEAAAVIKRDSREAGHAIARGAKATGEA